MLWNRRVALCLGMIMLLGTVSVAAEKIVLNVWLNTQTTQAIEVMRNKLIPAFEKEYPGITVAVTPVPWRERADKLTVAFASGVAPDIYQIGSDQIIAEVANGFPMALDSWVNKWDGRTDFLPEAWKPTQWNGHQYGVPWVLTGRHLLYLTSVFEEAGLDAERAPRSWEDLTDYTRKILKTAPDGQTERLGFYWGWPQPQALFWFLWQNKAEIVDEATGTALFNTAEGRETLAFLRDIYQMQGTPRNYPGFSRRGIGIFYNVTDATANDIRRNAPELYDELRMFTVER